MAILLNPVVRYWRCPSCGLTDRTERSDAHCQMHPCPALNGVNLPLVEVLHPDDAPDGRHVPVACEDSPEIASIRTERGDGSNDCTVLMAPIMVAPTFQ